MAQNWVQNCGHKFDCCHDDNDIYADFPCFAILSRV